VSSSGSWCADYLSWRLPVRVMRAGPARVTIAGMSEQVLAVLSNQMADVVAAASASVVQVQGSRQPASGVVVRPDVVLTTGRALGRENGLRVRTPDGRAIDAELAGWDPVTRLAVLRAPGLETPAATAAGEPARVGHLAIAIGRSWSNAVTATVGNVAIIGGPLPTGRGRAIDEIIRTTAPMHQGFAGGALVSVAGHVLGMTTAAEIRGLGVVIPARLAWKVAEDILEHGQLKHGYLGLAGQTVRLTDRQRGADGPKTGLLVIGLTPGGPADQAGLLVGDIVTTFDGVAIDSTDRLLETLSGDRVGRTVTIGVRRGGDAADLSATVGERPAR
jgi:S1-C subfamily serine protease